MAENPLLPHRKLQELYVLMQRCRSLDRKHALQWKAGKQGLSRPIAREAFLAATSIHLLPHDLLCVEPGDRPAEQLATTSEADCATASLLTTPDLSPRLLLCGAAARGLQAGSSASFVLAYASAGPASTCNAGWTAALEWAHSGQLPLLLACTDCTEDVAPRRGPMSRRSAAPPLDWAAMSRLAKRLRLPLFPVDGEDAVAVYRVMQECAQRARIGGGPAVLWARMASAAFGRPAALPRAEQPLARLRSYLAARQITLPG